MITRAPEDEIMRNLIGKTPEERAYLMISLFNRMVDKRRQDNEAVPEKLLKLYYGWLISPENRKAKDTAITRVFRETML